MHNSTATAFATPSLQDPSAGALAAPASPLAGATDRWQAWDHFLEATPAAGFMQASWWADFRANVGYDHFAVIARHRGAIIGGALVQKFAFAPGHCCYYMQDGPVLPDDESEAAEVFAAIVEEVEDHRRNESQTVSHLRIEPRWQRLPAFVSGFRPLAFRDRYVEPRDTLCIDLRAPEEEILAQMKPKGRYNIRVAKRHGVSILQEDCESGIADFLRIYSDMACRQGIDAKHSVYFETLLPMLASLRRGSIFFAEHAGRRLAAALVVYFGPRATYFYGGSLDEHRQAMAPYLLHFEIMRRAKAMGHECYDLWGVAPQNQPDHPWQNISAFKRKFGGSEISLVPTLDYVYDSGAYDRYAASRS